jgi:DNA-binding response OmpR family regulator
VVEADEAIAELIWLILDDSGYAADRVTNARDALDYLQGEPLPAAVLLDLDLPGTSGISLLRACRQSDRLSHLSILVLTGWPSPEFAADLVPDAMMQKPFDIDALCAAVDRITGAPEPAFVNAACHLHRPGRTHVR